MGAQREITVLCARRPSTKYLIKQFNDAAYRI
jgi:hypothetical protein